MTDTFNPETDLEITRLLAAPVAKVWRCWTEPDLLVHWFAPKPVVVRDVTIDLRAGGAFGNTMDVPDHGTMVGMGCFLEVIHERRLVWTDLMGPGFRPNAGSFGFTAIISFEPEGTGTRYTARAMHRDAAGAKQHSDMGFHDGWGTVAKQLDEFALTL